jgi:sigma-E factor negative regulatory protein RseC
MEELGTVVEVAGRHAWVAMERRSACGACASAEGCSGGVLAGLFGRRPVGLRVLNEAGARPGDRVVVAVAVEAVTRGALAVYATPLVGMLGGAAVGELVATRLAVVPADAAALVLGGLGFAAGLFWARGLAGRMSRDGRSEPVITRRLSV